MNKSWHHQRTLRKQQLLKEIRQQRQSLSACSRHWLEITQPYDKGWQVLLAFKPYATLGAGIVLFYGLCHPKKFYRWSRHMIPLVGIMKVVRNALNKS
ncbi:cell division protein FtsH [Xenorhabdus beddingii]|uniref:Cell division protein FtsH n=1 Tax=Xenorhabdus beddingii TaxID=40578 RepID=A0A1Y2SQ37_9GAMM|nr:YqjK-like family protein [Xenorhabdus beddingii]OTA20188.1 cell division protein FtsH [Xenorhabdus beddingii]